MKKKSLNARVVIVGSNSFVASYFKKKAKKNKIKLLEINRKKIDLSKSESQKKLQKTIKDGDIVILFANKGPVKNVEMFSENLNICRNICMALEKKNIKQFIYLSSDAVYSDSKKKLTELSETNPENLHGIMHITREKILFKFFKKILCILRPTLIYGPKDPHNGYGPNKFIRLVSKNKNILLFGKGEEKRDHVNVKDVASIILEVIKKNYTGTFNLASGEVKSFRKIAETIVSYFNNNSLIKFKKRIGEMPHNGYRAFDTTKLKRKIPEIKLCKVLNGIKSFYRESY